MRLNGTQEPAEHWELRHDSVVEIDEAREWSLNTDLLRDGRIGCLIMRIVSSVDEWVLQYQCSRQQRKAATADNLFGRGFSCTAVSAVAVFIFRISIACFSKAAMGTLYLPPLQDCCCGWCRCGAS